MNFKKILNIFAHKTENHLKLKTNVSICDFQWTKTYKIYRFIHYRDFFMKLKIELYLN